MAGWLYAIRTIRQGEFKVVGNVRMVNTLMQIDIEPKNFTTFNLIEVLKTPYHFPWDERAGRKYYWQVLIKSVFTGDWDMGDRVHNTMRVVHVVNTLLLLVVLAALFKELLFSPRKNVPMWALIIFLVLAQIGVVVWEKFAGLQKFRYVAVMAVPVTYYFICGLSLMKPKLRNIFLELYWFFVVLCVILMFVVLSSVEL